MAEIFGFTIDRKKNDNNVVSFTPKESDDGAVVVSSGGVYGTYVDLDGAVQSDAELITKYREMSLYPDVECAIDDIVNESITNNPDEPVVKIILDNLDQPDAIKKMVEEESKKIFELLELNSRGYEVFRRWYIDGRLYYHIIIDNDNPQDGVQEVRYIDPRKIRKIRETKAKRSGKYNDLTVKEVSSEYFIYNDKGFSKTNKTSVQSASDVKGVKIAKDAIAYISSGLMNANNDLVLSHLHKAIKPLNQLKAMEDSLVIYRISRAPERRIFYIDVGTLPKAKAEQHMKDMMTKFKNRVVYDSSTGEIRDDRRHMSMLEDFWLARRGEKGTEITTLPGGQNLGNMDDVNYFQEKLFKSLNVPSSRLNPDAGFNIGRSSEISRDEVKFQKFISRLRMRFQEIFSIILGQQLILKGVLTEEEWKEFSSKIAYRFSQDNFWAELKELEIRNERMNLLERADVFAGKYFSHEDIRKNILRQTDQEIEEIDKQNKEEMQNPQYMSSYSAQFDAANQQAADEQPPSSDNKTNK